MCSLYAPSDETVPAGSTVRIAGHDTNFYDVGEGPPVVLLHGSGPGVSAYSNWNAVIPALAQGLRVVAVDIAGFGLSQFKADGDYGMRFWVSHLSEFLEAVGIERAVLVGNSFGGALGMAAAVFAAHRVSGLLLLGAPAGEFTMTEGLRSAWHYQPSIDAMRAALLRLPYDPAVVTESMVRQRFQLSARPGAQAAFQRLMPEPTGAPDELVRGAGAQFLRRIAAPTVVLHGRDDAVVPVCAAEFAATHIDGADLHVYGRCGHWVQLERSPEFVDEVVSLAQRVS